MPKNRTPRTVLTTRHKGDSAALIVAGGSGSRFKNKVPKQFVWLNGKPVFLWSVCAFLETQRFARIIVVVPPKLPYSLEPFKKKYGFETVIGGANRHDSVRAGLSLLDSSIQLVAIHDAARPLIDPNDIARCVRSAKQFGAALCAAPVVDTVKQASPALVIQKTIPRHSLWLAQTPQIFNRKLIEKAYQRIDHMKTAVTDDAQLVESLMRHNVRIIPCSALHIKLTTPDDLRHAQLVLRSRQ